MPSAETGPPLCNRCKANEALHTLRNETVCSPCFKSFISLKAVKRLEQLQRDTRASAGGKEGGGGGGGKGSGGGPPRTQRYLLALSPGGASSTALLSALWENQRQQRERGQKPRFELVAAAVDTELRGDDSSRDDDEAFFAPYAERFPGTQFRRVALEDALGLDTVDWAAILPAMTQQQDDPSSPSSPLASSTEPPARRLRDLLTRLPSTTSRADVVRLLVRHLLVRAAADESCAVLLMGYNTTSLAELTLSEAAKGRGFAVPWGVNDGWASFPRVSPRREDAAPADEDEAEKSSANGMLIYHPLRELFRKELLIYSGLTSPPLTPLLAENGGGGRSSSAAVVSHKDLGIDDVMARYFAEVEENYPSVVANVVRTTGKLNRFGGDGENGSCGLCGLGLDEVGDERWRGELGEQKNEGDGRGRLCYGCERSVYG
ncbi:hypothetical protein LQW54_011576 [Pestalotiopsis sp. IQ-011]